MFVWKRDRRGDNWNEHFGVFKVLTLVDQILILSDTETIAFQFTCQLYQFSQTLFIFGFYIVNLFYIHVRFL